MSEIKNDGLDQYMAKCKTLMGSAVKGLITSESCRNDWLVFMCCMLYCVQHFGGVTFPLTHQSGGCSIDRVYVI